MQVEYLRIDESGEWVRCGKCGRKMFKIRKNDKSICSTGIEIKCHSCKALNKFKESETIIDNGASSN